MTDSDAAQYGSDITQYSDPTGYQGGSHISDLPFIKRFTGKSDAVDDATSSETTTQDESPSLVGQITGLGADASFFIMDPIGTLVRSGLTIVLDLVQPLDELLLMVSGDDGEMQKQIDVLANVQTALSALAEEITSDVNDNLTNWEGQAADAASSELGALAASARYLAKEAEDIANLLDWARLLAQAIYEVIKAIIAELVAWLVTRGIVALALALASAGSSVAVFLVSAVTKAMNMIMKAVSKFAAASRIFTKLVGIVVKSVLNRVGTTLVRQLLINPLLKAGAAVAKTAWAERDSLLDGVAALTAPENGYFTDVPSGTSDRFSVDPQELRAAASALLGRVPSAEAIASVSAEAEAAEMTWGLTGLAFEQSYSAGCSDLTDLIGSLAAAIRQDAASLTAAADEYEQTDDDAAVSFSEAVAS